MNYFAGLDVSVKDTSVRIVDGTGKIVREVKVATLAIFTATRRASSRVSNFAARSPPRLILEINIGQLLAVVIADNKTGGSRGSISR